MSRFRWYSTIHTLIKELQDEAIDPRSLLNVQGAPRKQELMTLIKNLEESLKELDEIVRKYQGLTRRDRSIWNQLRLATVDLEASRSKLTLHVTAINAFTASLSRGTLARIETILLDMASEVRQGRREPSLASLHERNNDSAWREIENELGIDGISSTDITKHKAAIKIFIQGLLSETEADTTSLVEIASLIECSNDNTDSESPSRSMSATDVSPEDSAKYLIASNTQNGSLVLLDEKEYEIPDISPQRGGVLIEVDWSSLSDLIVNYRYLIVRGGSKMTFEEVNTLLDTMTEDVRRLVVRSPILFRMSTRVRIIHSENARYGINLRTHFQTLTTSKDIKEIISLSAAYYNSLYPTGSDDSTQRYIKSRFMQMVVLLLSLLNDEDLAELKEFLEATYKLKADRRDIELLILKVIPLLSINPRVFLNALVPATEGFRLESGSPNIDKDHRDIWNVFIKRILGDGYLLPGTVEELGQGRLSWIVRWPDDGYKSSSIFDNLQYAGRLRTINDIPPVEVNPGSDCTELTVVMTDDSKYVINPRDLDNIVFMNQALIPCRRPQRENGVSI